MWLTMRLSTRPTIHPAKALSGDHLEVNTLIAILGIDQMRELDGVELKRSHVSPLPCHFRVWNAPSLGPHH